MLPIVHSRTPEVGFREAEAQGFDQVKGAVETHANPPNCSGVMGDFRVNEDNMYRRWHGDH
jgi:hypothetical protein